MPTQRRIKSSGNALSARVAGSMEAWDILHGILHIKPDNPTESYLMRELTQPKLTLIPQIRVDSTMRSLTLTLPVSKLSTAPAPRAMDRCSSYCGWDCRPGYRTLKPCDSRNRAIWSALACCFSMRTARVFIPRKRSQESKGDSPQPEALIVKYIFYSKKEGLCGSTSPKAESCTARTPAMRSWWPLRYFVADS